MPQINQRTVVLLNVTSITTNGTGPDLVLPAGLWSAATFTLANSTNSGTTQTLNVFVQKKLRQAAATDTAGIDATGTGIYDDLLAFGQITTTTVTRIANLVTFDPQPSANASVVTSLDYLQSDGALTASNARVGPLGGTWRCKYTVSGTNPVYTFSVVAELSPWGG